MNMRNTLYKGLSALVILAVTAVPALAEGTFSHPPVDGDPHGKIEGENPHQKFKEGTMGKHGRSSKHGSFSAHGSGSSHSSFSGHGRSPGHGKSSAHSKSGSFSEKGIKAKLHLDEEQSKKMHRLFMDYRKGTILKRANVRVAQIELDEAVGGGDFNLALIEKKAKRKESAATELVMVRVQALAKAKAFLSDDQFKRFIGIVAHRMGKGGHHAKANRHGKKGSSHHSFKSKSRHHGGGSMGGSTHGGFSDSEGY